MKKCNPKFTEKDLLYIEDMFNWNMETLKLVNHFLNEVQNEDVKELLEEILEMHYENMYKCISILKGNHEECEECETYEEYTNEEEEEYQDE